MSAGGRLAFGSTLIAGATSKVYMTAERLPASGLPTNSQFFCRRRFGRCRRVVVDLTRPSWRKVPARRAIGQWRIER
jgi:hypothetical protein